jgi:hypothetical protein
MSDREPEMNKTRSVFRRIIFIIVMALVAAAVVDQLRRPASERTWNGDILGIPYDFRFPTPQRLQEKWWNPSGPLFTPHTFGVGWSINIYRLMHIDEAAMLKKLGTAVKS